MSDELDRMDPAIEQLAVLAERWQNASRNNASGWGAGSATMARSYDSAKAAFVDALANLRPAQLADAIALLARYQRRIDHIKNAHVA
jgi:hypothetical protein